MTDVKTTSRGERAARAEAAAQEGRQVWAEIAAETARRAANKERLRALRLAAEAKAAEQAKRAKPAARTRRKASS